MTPVIGYCLLDATGHVLAQAAPERAFYAASTIKLSVMAAIARLVDADALAWNDELAVRSVFDSAVAGAPPFAMDPDDRDDRMPPDGERMTVLELVRAMIRRSSNEATDLLMPLAGFAAMAAVHADAAAVGCRVERLIGDTAARDAGATNEVSPLGLARLMHAIVTGRLASPQSTRVMVEVLRGQELPCIAEVLPAGIPWGSKSGWVPGFEHDVAFVGEPGSLGEPGEHGEPGDTGDAGLRVLAVCTGGFPDRDARAEIRRVSSALLIDIDAM